MTQPLDLDQIETVIAAATPGPWGVYEFGYMIEIAADLEETGHGYHARRVLARFDEEPLDNDPTHREWTAEEDWAQVQADAAFIAAMSPETAAAMAAEIRRLRDRVTELERRTEDLDFLERTTLPELRREIEHHKDGKQRWRGRAEKAAADRAAAEETHVVADDTIWLERRPCGCIVAAVVAIVPGTWTLTTAEDAALHFHDTEGERRRAAAAGLTVEPVTGAQYREQFRDRWHCGRHTAAGSAAARP